MTPPREVLQRAEGRLLFGRDPSGYAAGRPDYPSFVYDHLRETCGLAPGSRILEIGPGTGVATRQMLSAGARVMAVEPDPSLASFLRHANPTDDLQTTESTLEDAEIEYGRFDLVSRARGSGDNWHHVSGACEEAADTRSQ